MKSDSKDPLYCSHYDYQKHLIINIFQIENADTDVCILNFHIYLLHMRKLPLEIEDYETTVCTFFSLPHPFCLVESFYLIFLRLKMLRKMNFYYC